MSAPCGRVVVVGAGSSGLRATLGLARLGLEVDLLSLAEPRHEPAASAGRVVAAGAEDLQVADALEVAGGLAPEAALRSMVRASDGLVGELVRLGVPFARSPEGALVRHAGAGHAEPRLLDADLATRMHAVRALDDTVRGLAAGAAAAVRRWPGWEVVSLAQDPGGVVIGVVAQDLRTMELRAFPAAAVVLASGGFARLWGPCTAVSTATGSATVAAVRAGAVLANPEMLEVVPAALVGPDKPRAVPEALRDLGATLWVPRDPKDARRARDVPSADRATLVGPGAAPLAHQAARELLIGLRTEGRGVVDPVSNELAARAYLDARGVDPARLAARLGTGRAALERFLGVDVAKEPLLISPAAHATLGGLWVDLDVDDRGAPRSGSARHHGASLPGLFVVGGAAHAYHGAARLPGHRLLASLHGGASVVDAVAIHVRGLVDPAGERSAAELARVLRGEEKTWSALLERSGGGEEGDTPDALGAELGAAMWRGAGPLRDDEGLDALREELAQLEERARRAPCPDRSGFANRSAPALRRLEGMLLLARFVVLGARRRDESRGTHFKASRPVPDEARFRAPTRARWREGDVTFEVDDG